MVDEETCEESTLSLQMLVHALDRTVYYRIVRVKGRVMGKIVYLLIDSCSTHNFLDLDIARKLKCKLKTIPTFSVSMANRSNVHSSFMSRGRMGDAHGVFQGYYVSHSIRGADVVLDIQWLITFGDTKWNLKQLKVEFQIVAKKYH